MPDLTRIYIPESRLVALDGEVWDMETEEALCETDAYEAIVAGLSNDELEDDVFVDAVLQRVMSGRTLDLTN